MKAIEVAAYGGPDVLRLKDMPDPTAGPGQVVIRVTGVDVLFLDAHIRGGWGEPLTLRGIDQVQFAPSSWRSTPVMRSPSPPRVVWPP